MANKMATCENGHEVGPDKRFCPMCGAPAIATKFCTLCGAAVRADGRFCDNCGATTQRPATQAGRQTVILPPVEPFFAAPVLVPESPSPGPARWIVPLIVILVLAIGATSFFLIRGRTGARKTAGGTQPGTATTTHSVPAQTTTTVALPTVPTQPNTAATQQAAFTELDAQVQVAARGRTMVNALVSQQNQNCRLTPASAASQLNAVIANRNGVALQAQAIASSVSGGLSVATELGQAMQTSIDADNSWSAWFTTTYQSFYEGGCAGTPSTNGDPNWDQFAALSRQADTTKQQFVNDYNRQAAAFGLKADWKPSDL